MLMPVFDNRRSKVDLSQLPAARLVPPPVGARRLARNLAILFVLTQLALIAAPWQQNVSGAGRVIAFAPTERQQRIQAPVKGRIVRWFVREGQEVQAGEALVEIQDNDPNFFDRIRQTRSAIEAQMGVYRSQVEQLNGYVNALAEARDRAVEQAEAAVAEATQKVRATEQKLRAASAARETAQINLGRTRELFQRGLVSRRKMELAELKATKTETDLETATADVKAANNALSGKRAGLNNKRAEAEAKVENARASRAKAEASVQDAAAKLLDLDVKLARQSSQKILAPRDAYVLRIDKLPGQEQVKAGDILGVLVPTSLDRVAELYVDGNDAAIISAGRKVRLQFEGWPAVQFAGWPSVAVGTFGGVVAFVDSADDGKGDFRIIVRPDPDEDGWPNAQFLRQGTRAKGWILLDEVRLGYELWRRFNGFPPATNIPPTGSGKLKKPEAKPGKGHGK